MNVEAIVGRATPDETMELAIRALQALPQDVALQVVKDWIFSEELQDEILATFGAEEE